MGQDTIMGQQDYNDSFTLVIRAHVLQSRLATTAGFPVHTESNKDQLDLVWSPRMTSDTLSRSPSSAPHQAVPVKNPELQVLSNALLLLPPGFPSRTTPPKAGGTRHFRTLWKCKPQCHMCVHGLVKRVTLALMGDIPHTSPHPGQHRHNWEPGGENHLSYAFYSSSSRIKTT